MLAFSARLTVFSMLALSLFSADIGERRQMFNSFAYIFLMPGFAPDRNTTSMENDGYRFKTVGIDINHKEEVIKVAKQLAEEGYQMIELCGGFGPEWIHRVTVELENKVPVGGVFYGPQFRQQLADLFKK